MHLFSHFLYSFLPLPPYHSLTLICLPTTTNTLSCFTHFNLECLCPSLFSSTRLAGKPAPGRPLQQFGLPSSFRRRRRRRHQHRWHHQPTTCICPFVCQCLLEPVSWSIEKRVNYIIRRFDQSLQRSAGRSQVADSSHLSSVLRWTKWVSRILW